MTDLGKHTAQELKARNIVQWTEHCDKLEARGNLTEDQQDDLEYRRMQVKRWKAEG